VSKALPYKHFENVTSALAELYQREARRLARDIWQALKKADAEDDDLVRVWVSTYFDSLAQHGAVLRALSAPGSGIPSLADPRGAGASAVATVLRQFLGVDRKRAKEVSGMIQGAMVGAAHSWMNGIVRRPAIEDLVVTLVRTVMDAPVERGRRTPATSRARR
jgi:AcrR family transcriptional regulator